MIDEWYMQAQYGISTAENHYRVVLAGNIRQRWQIQIQNCYTIIVVEICP
jgi:hypothetical protein